MIDKKWMIPQKHFQNSIRTKMEVSLRNGGGGHNGGYVYGGGGADIFGTKVF